MGLGESRPLDRVIVFIQRDDALAQQVVHRLSALRLVSGKHVIKAAVLADDDDDMFDRADRMTQCARAWDVSRRQLRRGSEHRSERELKRGEKHYRTTHGVQGLIENSSHGHETPPLKDDAQ